MVPTYVGGGEGNHNYTEYARIGTKECGEGSVDLLDINGTGKRGDSVFWTQSAVEKFLVPYYASAYGDLAARSVEQLQSIFVPPGSPELDGNGMITGTASVSSLPTNLATPEVGIESPVDADDTPFAVVHLPSSEYAAEGLEDGLPRLFTLHRSGKVKKI